MIATVWNIDPVKILTRRELACVLEDLQRKAPRSASVRMNRVIFRLATCAGLRVSEIRALCLEDLHVATERPHLRVRPEGAKGKRARVVPLWWDAATLEDIKAWKQEREGHGARPGDPFVCCLKPCRFGKRLVRHGIRERFRTSCKSLGLDRLKSITTHCGRHSFVSHALAGGRSLAEVQRAVGHSSLVTTSVYLHVAVDDDAVPGCLFDFPPARKVAASASR